MTGKETRKLKSTNDFFSAPNFTVWEGATDRGFFKAESRLLPKGWWDLFAQEGEAYIDDKVMEELERRGIELEGEEGSYFAPNTDDEVCRSFELKLDDINAAEAALHYGHMLVKVPDKMRDKRYFRLYVVHRFS